jgi:hypothetical protein
VGDQSQLAPSAPRQYRPVAPRYRVRRDRKLQRAQAWLVSALQHTWVPATKLQAAAKAAGISWRTLERVKAQPPIILGPYKWAFESRRRVGVWYWRLLTEMKDRQFKDGNKQTSRECFHPHR